GVGDGPTVPFVLIVELPSVRGSRQTCHGRSLGPVEAADNPAFASRGDDDSLVGTRSSDKGRLVVREQYCWQTRLLHSVHQREKIPTGFANQESRTTGDMRRKQKSGNSTGAERSVPRPSVVARTSG